MPLHLDPALISRASDRPLHRQLADVIAAAIRSGELAPNEPLPAEFVIAAQMELSSTPVRAALAQLAQEGKVVKRAGMPTRVAPRTIHRHMATARYAAEIAILESLKPGEPHPLTSAFVTDHGIPWEEYSVPHPSCVESTATGDEATQLLLPPGAPVLRRQLMKYGGDHPPQAQHSVIPLELVQGTAAADPNREPFPGGTLALLWEVGVRKPITVSEEAESRTATAAERETLQMAARGPVLVVVRLFTGALLDPAGQLLPPRPVEMSTVVLPAAGVTLAWETTLL